MTVLLVVVIAVCAALAVDAVRTRQYKSTAQVLLLSQNTSSTGSVTPLASTDVTTDIQLMLSAGIRAAAAASLGWVPPEPSVSQLSTTNVAEISVATTTPVKAAQAANAYANAYIDSTRAAFVAQQLATENVVQTQINAIQAQITQLQGKINSSSSTASAAASAANQATTAQLVNLYGQQSALHSQLLSLQLATSQASSGGRLVSKAVPVSKPVSPSPVRDAILAGVVGLVLGIIIVLVWDLLDDRIRSKTDLEEAVASYELPTLGLIPVIDGWKQRSATHLVAIEDPSCPAAEAYRGLRTSIQFMGLDKPIRTLQITSPSAAEGKTTTSANLAVTMAQSGQRVVLVGCDLRRPRIHQFFGIPNNIGFTSVLVGDASLEEALVPVPGIDHLILLPSGPVPPNPSELLGSQKARELFAQLGEYADVVLLDSPPVLPVTDASVLATNVDGVVLVAAAGISSRHDVTNALDNLERVSAPVAGTILNREEVDSYVYYRYGDSYERQRDTSPYPSDVDTAADLVPARAPRRRNGTSRGRSGSTQVVVVDDNGMEHPRLNGERSGHAAAQPQPHPAPSATTLAPVPLRHPPLHPAPPGRPPHAHPAIERRHDRPPTPSQPDPARGGHRGSRAGHRRSGAGLLQLAGADACPKRTRGGPQRTLTTGPEQARALDRGRAGRSKRHPRAGVGAGGSGQPHPGQLVRPECVRLAPGAQHPAPRPARPGVGRLDHGAYRQRSIDPGRLARQHQQRHHDLAERAELLKGERRPGPGDPGPARPPERRPHRKPRERPGEVRRRRPAAVGGARAGQRSPRVPPPLLGGRRLPHVPAGG